MVRKLLTDESNLDYCRDYREYPMEMDETMPEMNRPVEVIRQSPAMDRFYKNRPYPRPTSVMSKAIAMAELSPTFVNSQNVRTYAQKLAGNPHTFDMETQTENESGEVETQTDPEMRDMGIQTNEDMESMDRLYELEYEAKLEVEQDLKELERLDAEKTKSPEAEKRVAFF